MSRSGRGGGFRLIGLALALVVVSRLLLHLAAPAQLHHPEEFINLRLAATLLGDDVVAGAQGDGGGGDAVSLPDYPPPTPGDEPLQRSLFDFQYQDWDGGTLVVSMALVPVALLFGLGTTTIKLGALLWFLALCLGWVLLLHRLYGDRGAQASALAFAALPVPFVLLSSIHWGNHAESTVFVPYVLWSLVRATEASAGARRLPWVALAGVLAGFGAWFSLLNLLPLLLVVVLLPVLFRSGVASSLLVFVPSACLGFLPWLGRNDWVGGQGLEAQGYSVSGLLERLVDYGWTPGRLLELFVREPSVAHWELYGLWSMPTGLAGSLDLVTRTAVVLAAGTALFVVRPRLHDSSLPEARSRRFVLLVVVFNLLFLPVLLASQGEHSARRLAPMYPLAWVCLCMGFLSLARQSPLQLPLRAALAALLSCHLLALGGVILSGDRPEVAMEPWLHFAVPEREPRQRTEIGVPQVAPDQVGELHAVLGDLFEASTTGGADEVRGLGRSFAGRGTFLHRTRPACPPDNDVDIMELWLVGSEREAQAVGEGLRIRCGDAPARVVEICQKLNGANYRSACEAVVQVEARDRPPAAPED